MTETAKRQRRSKKAGLPPGSLVFVGEKTAGKARISLIEYDSGVVNERRLERVEECLPSRDTAQISWIDIEGVADTEVVGMIGTHFGIHPLVLEDIVNTDKRPTCEEYDGYVFLSLKMLTRNSKTGELVSEQVSLVLGPTWVLSFQEGREGDAFHPVRERIRGGKGRIRHSGADYLAYALLDATVDGYFSVLEELGEDIEKIERVVAASPSEEALADIYRAKRYSVFLRRAVWPVREIAAHLERMENALIAPTTRMYLRDVYTHAIEVIDILESHREIVAGMLELYHSSISNKLNKVMMVLTLVTTIFMPLSFIAGVYGMNFKYMPELELPYGYPLILGAMFVIAGTMLSYFRRKRWL